MPNNIEEKIVSEITEVALYKITSGADFFTDLGVDSLKAIEIVAALEKRYRVLIPEKDIPKIRTINQILEYTKGLKKD
jgi:acyl carrier protein